MLENQQKNASPSSLTKYISPAAVWALSFGCSVGWGAFVMPGTTFLPVSGPLGTVIGMLIGTLIMYIIGQNYLFMMSHVSDAGGTYAYAKKQFGSDHGFLSAWFLFLAYIAIIWANSTALSLAVRYTFGDIFRTGLHYDLAGYDIYLGEAFLSAAAVLVLSIVCICGKRAAAVLQTVMSGVLIIGIIICFCSVISANKGGAAAFRPAFASGINHVSQIFRVIALVPWAFVGYESVCHSSEELNFPAKKQSGLFIISILSITAAYILLTLTAVPLYPEGYSCWEEYIRDIGELSGTDSVPVFSAVRRSMGEGGTAFIGVVMLCALFTGILGNMIAVSRLLYSMSADGILPRWFGKLNKDSNPVNAVIFTAAISLVIPFFGRTVVGWPIDVSTIGAAIAYGYTSAAVFRTASAEGNRLRKITGIAGAVMSVIFCLLLLVPNYLSGGVLAKESYLILAVWCILGFVLFHRIFRKDRADMFGRSMVVWLALIALIVFSSMMWLRQSTYSLAEDTVNNISSYYAEDMQRSGIDQSEEQIRKEEEFLEKQMDRMNKSLLGNTLVQTGLILISMVIMFNVYSIMRKRQNRMEIEKMRAEENSRAKSFFLSNMSHDLRTPMNAIIGYTELARREGCSAEEIREYLNKISSSGKHLLALINDILEMSRIENGKAEPEIAEADLVKIMSDIRDMFSTQMNSKSIIFTVDSSGITDRCVMCDEKRLNRILLNLVSNAFKFTPEGGSVYVSLVQTDSNDADASFELRVKDSGIGMSPEFADRVFEAFERERTSTASGIQGTGLGMAITKSFVDIMDGTIRVVTAPGEGTEFIVELTFPAVRHETGHGTDCGTYSSEDTVDFSTKRLLLVEDNEINREIAVLILEEAGFTVETAENGRLAVDRICSAEAGYYDLVLMDVQMPVMNGLDATRAVRALGGERSEVPIIAMTANAFKEDIEAEQAAGMNSHISKPFDTQKMLDTISSVLSENK